MGYNNDPFFDILFKNGFNPATFFEPFNTAQKVPYPVDVYTNKEFLIFEIPLLKVTKDDIDITKEGNTLRVKLVRPKVDNPEVKYIHKKVAYRDFDLMWKISNEFDLSGIQSVYEHGLLTIYIPFSEQYKKEPEKVQVLDTLENWQKLNNGTL